MTCGACTLCCKLLAVDELAKPACSWCALAEPGKGCRTYDERPDSCRAFECLWLQTQSHEIGKFPGDLRPDRCRVILTTTEDGDTLVAHVDPSYPNAYLEGGVGHLIRSFRDRREAVVIVTGERRKLLTVREVTL